LRRALRPLDKRPFPQWTIARAIDVYYHRKDDVEAHRALAALAPLSEQWRSHFERLLEDRSLLGSGY
jgi:MOSC domain-containing protein YiiM